MERVSGASESGAARPLPYPNPGRGRVTVNGLVTQPQPDGAGIGPTSIKTHAFISGGGGACPDSWTTPVDNTRPQAKIRQAGRGSRRIRRTGLEAGDGVLAWETSAQDLPKKPASVSRGPRFGPTDRLTHLQRDPQIRRPRPWEIR